MLGDGRWARPPEDTVRRLAQRSRFLHRQLGQLLQPLDVCAQLVVDDGLYKGREVFLDLLFPERVRDELALLDCEPVLIDSVAAEPLDLGVHWPSPSSRCFIRRIPERLTFSLQLLP